MLTAGSEEMQPDELMAYRMFRRVVPSTDTYRNDGNFFVREDGRLKATPLAAVLVVIESSDLMFAVDSIPAIFAVTRDLFSSTRRTCSPSSACARCSSCWPGSSTSSRT